MSTEKRIKLRTLKDLIKKVKQGKVKRSDAVSQIESVYFENKIPHSVYHKLIGKLYC